MKKNILNLMLIASSTVLAISGAITAKSNIIVAHAADDGMATITVGSTTYNDLKSAVGAASSTNPVVIGSGLVNFDSAITVSSSVTIEINGNCTFMPSAKLTGFMFNLSKNTSFVCKVNGNENSLTVGHDKEERKCGFALSSGANVTILGDAKFQKLTTDSYGVIASNSSKNPVDLTLDKCHFVECKGTNGGAVSVVVKNEAKISNCSFENCSSTNGGAIYFDGKSGGNSINISGSSFSGCSATNGGAIYANGASGTLTDVTIENCTADKGGAVFSSLEGFNLNDTTISDNKAVDGGAIYATKGTINVDENSEIRGNDATNSGSGIASSSGVTINGEENIHGNTTNGELPDHGSSVDEAIKSLKTQVSLSFGFVEQQGKYTFNIKSNGQKKDNVVGITYRTLIPMNIWNDIKNDTKSIGLDYGTSGASKNVDTLYKNVKSFNADVSEEGNDVVSTSIRILVPLSYKTSITFGHGYVKTADGNKHMIGERREYSIQSLAQTYLNSGIELDQETTSALEALAE